MILPSGDGGEGRRELHTTEEGRAEVCIVIRLSIPRSRHVRSHAKTKYPAVQKGGSV